MPAVRLYALAGIMALSGCMAADTGLPRVSAAQAVAVFQKTCMAAPYNAAANRAAFRKQSGWQQEGEVFKTPSIESVGFESTTMRISGSSSVLNDNSSCSVRFTPAESATKEGTTATVLLSALTGDRTPSGRKGGGMISLDYKEGKAVVSVSRKTGDVSLSLLKI